METLLVQLVNLGGFLGMLMFLAYNIFLKTEPKDSSLGEKMDTLSNYYNHETTDLLREIKDEVKKTNVTLSTWEKYGAPQIKP